MLQLTFRNKELHYDLGGIQVLAKALGIKVPVAWINEETLKSRELSNPFKEKLYNSVCKMVCEENGFAYKPAPATGFVQYKAFIGKGNNS